MRLTVPVVVTMTLWLCLADRVGEARARTATQAAAGTQPRVLVLYGSRRDAAPAASLDIVLRRTLEAGLGPGLDLYSEYLDVVRFEDAGYQSAMRALLRQQYAGIGVDVVIAICDSCANFAETLREDLFPVASIVYWRIEPAPPSDHSTGILGTQDFTRTLRFISTLQPDVEHVYVVSGSSGFDRHKERAARKQFAPFAGRFSFTWLTGLTMPDLLERAANLPPQSVIYSLAVTEDGGGNNYTIVDSLEQLAAAANVPVYSWYDVLLGHGIVGGSLMDSRTIANALGNLAVRILRGEHPSQIPVEYNDYMTPQLDWRQLQRFALNASLVPEGTAIHFRSPTLWQLYWPYIVGAVSLVLLQAFLIGVLLVQQSRRRKAEVLLRDSVAALEASHGQNRSLAGRLITAQEAERSRIARELHDDVSQGVAGTTVDLGILRRRIADADMESQQILAVAHERMVALSEGLRALSHELHPGLLGHLGLQAALESYCAEAERNNDLQVAFRAEGPINALPMDVALCLYRIVQEAVRNGARHGGARHASVDLSLVDGRLDLQVRDDGQGFVPTAAPGRGGLGILSMSERAHLMGGVLNIDSAPGRGAVVLVRAELENFPGRTGWQPGPHGVTANGAPLTANQ